MHEIRDMQNMKACVVTYQTDLLKKQI